MAVLFVLFFFNWMLDRHIGNKFTEVSGIQFHNTSSVYCFVGLPSQIVPFHHHLSPHVKMSLLNVRFIFQEGGSGTMLLLNQVSPLKSQPVTLTCITLVTTISKRDWKAYFHRAHHPLIVQGSGAIDERMAFCHEVCRNKQTPFRRQDVNHICKTGIGQEILVSVIVSDQVASLPK